MGESRIMQEQLSRATHGAVAEDAVAIRPGYLLITIIMAASMELNRVDVAWV